MRYIIFSLPCGAQKALTETVRSKEGRPLKILARQIARELEVQPEEIGHCAIYEDKLQRIWPINEENRKAKIAQFANKNGFRLVYYKRGLCAIFEEEGVTK